MNNTVRARALTGAAVSVSAVLALAACASAPPDYFYTLGGAVAAASGVASGVASAGMALANAPAMPREPFYIEVPPVDVPQQVARNQFVVTTGPGRADIIEHRRWLAPLSNEIGSALSADLSRSLGAIDVYRTPHAATQPVYRINVNVQRFESVLDSRASLAAVWSVRAVASDAVVTCRSDITVPVGQGYDALVDGHRSAIAQLSSDIAVTVRHVTASSAPGAKSAAAMPDAGQTCPAGRS
jgi:uncharacterized lipoprotein YmbA